MWVGKLSWKATFPIPEDNSFPTTWSRFLFCFVFPLYSFQHQLDTEQKEINNDCYCSSAESSKSVTQSRFHCMSLCVVGLAGCAQSTMTAPAPVGANAGRLASEQERWKTSNVITDSLSVPFELFTDWVNDYRQCVSWPGARISYPPARYYQRALPCLAGVLPKHLTEMPTQKECSECVLSPEARARKLEYQAWIRCWGGWASRAAQDWGKGQGRTWDQENQIPF